MTKCLLHIGLLFTIAAPVAAAGVDSTGPAQPEDRDTIVVTAPRLRERMEAGQSLTIIDAEEWEGTGKGIADVIAEQTGVQTRRYGGTGSFQTVSIRGVEGRDVLVFLDGLPLNSVMGGAVDLSVVDPARIASIEVYKGQIPSRFGGNSIGGVINLVSRTATGRDGVTAAAAAGTYGYGAGSVQFSTTPAEGRYIHGLLSYTRSDNDWPYLDRNNTPYNPDDDVARRVENHQYQNLEMRLQPKLFLSPTAVLTTGLSFSTGSRGIPATEGHVNRTARYDRGMLDFISRLHWFGLTEKLHLELVPEIGFLHLDEYTFWTSIDESMGTSHGGFSSIPDSYGESRFLMRVLHAACLATWRPNPVICLETVASSRFSDADSETRATGFPHGDWPGRRQEGRLAADLNLSGKNGDFSVGSILGGSIAAIRSATDGGYNRVFEQDVPASDTLISVWSAKVGGHLRYKERLTVFTSVGRYSDPPDLREKFGARGAVVPNPDLKEETGIQMEAGAKCAYARHFIEAVLFRVSRSNAIYMASDGNMTIPKNLGATLVYGLEATYAGSPCRWLKLECRGTLQHTENRYRINNWYGNVLPNEPAVSLLGKATFGPFKKIKMGYWADWKSYFYRDFGNTGGQRVPEDPDAPGLLFHNVQFSWIPSENMELSLVGRNIANTNLRYDEVVQTAEGGYSWILYPENEWTLSATYSF